MLEAAAATCRSRPKLLRREEARAEEAEEAGGSEGFTLKSLTCC